MAWEDADAFNDFSLSSSSVLSITLTNTNHRCTLISIWELPQCTSWWSKKGLCNRPAFERSCFIMDSMICSKSYSSKVRKKTIAKLQFRQEKHKRGCAHSFIPCGYGLKNGRNVGFGKMKMVLYKGYAPMEISFPLTEEVIEWENPLSTFALRSIWGLASCT